MGVRHFIKDRITQQLVIVSTGKVKGTSVFHMFIIMWVLFKHEVQYHGDMYRSYRVTFFCVLSRRLIIYVEGWVHRSQAYHWMGCCHFKVAIVGHILQFQGDKYSTNQDLFINTDID